MLLFLVTFDITCFSGIFPFQWSLSDVEDVNLLFLVLTCDYCGYDVCVPKELPWYSLSSARITWCSV